MLRPTQTPSQTPLHFHFLTFFEIKTCEFSHQGQLRERATPFQMCPTVKEYQGCRLYRSSIESNENHRVRDSKGVFERSSTVDGTARRRSNPCANGIFLLMRHSQTHVYTANCEPFTQRTYCCALDGFYPVSLQLSRG